MTLTRDDIKLMLYHAFLRTKNAVFTTSFTTCFAFLATGISPIMPIAAFGIFCALAILMNFIFCLLITTPVLVANH